MATKFFGRQPTQDKPFTVVATRLGYGVVRAEFQANGWYAGVVRPVLDRQDMNLNAAIDWAHTYNSNR